jgi:aminoglycoside phosphotransferase (APT) family kinase protein
MATIGHPLSDLVNVCTPFLTAESGPDPHKGFVPGATPGLPTREQVVEWYTEVSGYDAKPDLVWGAAFGMFRSSVIFQGIAARYASRQASSAAAKTYADRMHPFGEYAYLLVKKSMDAFGWKAKL